MEVIEILTRRKKKEEKAERRFRHLQGRQVVNGAEAAIALSQQGPPLIFTASCRHSIQFNSIQFKSIQFKSIQIQNTDKRPIIKRKKDQDKHNKKEQVPTEECCSDLFRIADNGIAPEEPEEVCLVCVCVDEFQCLRCDG